MERGESSVKYRKCLHLGLTIHPRKNPPTLLSLHWADKYLFMEIELRLKQLHRSTPWTSYHIVTQNPGPGRYCRISEEKKHGYSMRPKTANNRTCKTHFIKTSSITRRWNWSLVLLSTASAELRGKKQYPSSEQSHSETWGCKPKEIGSRSMSVSLWLSRENSESLCLQPKKVCDIKVFKRRKDGKMHQTLFHWHSHPHVLYSRSR